MARADLPLALIGAMRSERKSPCLHFREDSRFAKATGRYKAMGPLPTDCLKLGEVLPLRREEFDGETLQVRRTVHEGQILEGTKTDHGEPDAGLVVPVPATLAWMLKAQINLNGPDSELLFTTPRGRHSYVTHLRAAGVNDADLAEIAGHRLETMLARYTHATVRALPQYERLLARRWLKWPFVAPLMREGGRLSPFVASQGARQPFTLRYLG